MTHLPQRQLEAELKYAPTPLADLEEDSRWLQIGEIRLSRVSARVSIGFPHPIGEATRFELQPFESAGRRGSAIVVSAIGTLPDYFVGWVAESEHVKASRWVDRLNSEVQARLAQANQDIEAGKVAQMLVYHQGGEFAPDSPWGGETLELSRAGELEYEQRRSGKLVQAASGRIDPSRVARLHEVLAGTGFPAMPQPFFPPGASVCTLITEPPFLTMPIELYAGLEMEGYGEILRALSGLCEALRSSSTEQLAQWAFVSATRV